MSIAVLACPLLGLPASATDVGGDDLRDEYVGRGSFFLPGGSPLHERAMTAGCTDCQWRLAAPCAEPTASTYGRPFDGSTVPAASWCTSTTRGCAGGTSLRRPWIREGSGPWRPLTIVCLGEGRLLARTTAAAAVREVVRSGVPPLSPHAQPTAGVVAQIPVLFDSAQPAGPRTWSPTIAGHAVVVRARPTWTWYFGDGATLQTDDPGGVFPVRSVQHAYRRAGRVQARVSAQWVAQYTVDGLGPFPVPGPIEQSQSIAVDVGEGRAELTAGVVAE